jgi:hypothetical protein
MREFGGRSANQHSSGRVDGLEKGTAIIYLRMITQLELEICNNLTERFINLANPVRV